jgi:hypothetical protein
VKSFVPERGDVLRVGGDLGDAGGANDAYIDYKKALEIYPENPYLQRDAVRLASGWGCGRIWRITPRRFPAAAETPADGDGELAGKARLVVVYEEGLAPKKSEMSVAYPLPSAGSIGVIALPGYVEVPPPPVPVGCRRAGKALGARRRSATWRAGGAGAGGADAGHPDAPGGAGGGQGGGGQGGQGCRQRFGECWRCCCTTCFPSRPICAAG